MKNVSVGKFTNYIADWLSIRSDMMLANESTITSTVNFDRELITKQGHPSVYAGFMMALSLMATKVKIGQQVTTRAHSPLV